MASSPFIPFKEFQGMNVVNNDNSFVCFSNYILPGAAIAFHSIALSVGDQANNIVFFCPQYVKISGNCCVMRDTQISVTGSPKCNEPPDFAAAREIQEELGFFKFPPSLISVPSTARDKFDRPVYNMFAEITDDTLPITSHIPSFSSEDDKSQKVQIFVFGHKNAIKAQEENLKKIIPLPSDDTKPKWGKDFIAGFRLISFGDIFHAIKNHSVCGLEMSQLIESRNSIGNDIKIHTTDVTTDGAVDNVVDDI